MTNKRREFLKLSGLAGACMVMGTLGAYGQDQDPFPQKHNQRFNMHDYAASKLDTVRLAFIGVAGRGASHLKRFASIEGVDIEAICDIIPGRVRAVIDSVKNSHRPDSYINSETAWKQLCEREDIYLVVISTPLHLHTPQAVYAMEHENHAATEFPAANTIEECWELVETSERTRRQFMMMDNSGYGDFGLLVLNMAREGFFGEIVHGEGTYIHYRVSQPSRWERDENDHIRFRLWRLDENAERNGNLYATHPFGTIVHVMDLNYGDKIEYLVSTSRNDFTLGAKMNEMAAKDAYFESYVVRNFRGNMNISTTRTNRGRTIMLQHDISSPRPNVRFNLISGTEAIAQQYPLPARIATNHEGWVSKEEFQRLAKKYKPEIIERMGRMAKELGGHGGKDAIMSWRPIDCLRNGIPLDMGVYDAAMSSCITSLSEWSVADRSNSVSVPDFTSGAWKTNKRGMDIGLKRVGTTKLV